MKIASAIWGLLLIMIPALLNVGGMSAQNVINNVETILPTETSKADTTQLKQIEQLATMNTPVDSASVNHKVDSTFRKFEKKTFKQPKALFSPNPQRALWLSFVFPGAGQIYNRKYWKLPFIYGGFLGCTYALMWNQQMYHDYSQAYLDITDDNPNTKSYNDLLPPGYDITGNEERFKTIFKNKKNFYRRYRDLSAFCFIGVYLLSVIDAYVDAQLSEFDISKDLSMKVRPTIINNYGMNKPTQSYGIGCSLDF